MPQPTKEQFDAAAQAVMKTAPAGLTRDQFFDLVDKELQRWRPSPIDRPGPARGEPAVMDDSGKAIGNGFLEPLVNNPMLQRTAHPESIGDFLSLIIPAAAPMGAMALGRRAIAGVKNTQGSGMLRAPGKFMEGFANYGAKFPAGPEGAMRSRLDKSLETGSFAEGGMIPKPLPPLGWRWSLPEPPEGSQGMLTVKPAPSPLPGWKPEGGTPFHEQPLFQQESRLRRIPAFRGWTSSPPGNVRSVIQQPDPILNELVQRSPSDVRAIAPQVAKPSADPIARELIGSPPHMSQGRPPAITSLKADKIPPEMWGELRRYYGAEKLAALTGKTRAQIEALAAGPSRTPMEIESQLMDDPRGVFKYPR